MGEISALASSFERYPRAANRSPRTVETYLDAVRRFNAFLGYVVACPSNLQTAPSVSTVNYSGRVVAQRRHHQGRR